MKIWHDQADKKILWVGVGVGVVFVEYKDRTEPINKNIPSWLRFESLFIQSKLKQQPNSPQPNPTPQDAVKSDEGTRQMLDFFSHKV